MGGVRTAVPTRSRRLCKAATSLKAIWTPETIPATAATPPAIIGDPDKVAYLAFTSGTTGTPKCVMHSDNTLLANARDLARDWGHGPHSKILSLSPLSHHIAWVGVAQWLVAGAEFITDDPPAGQSRLDWIIETEATYVLGVPTHAMDILAEQSKRGIARLGNVQLFYMAGSPIPPTTASAFVAQGIKPQNVYGMTENSSHQYTHPTDTTETIVTTCGRGGPAYEVRLFDPADADVEVPVGTVGQIGGRGAALMLGYFDNQAATEVELQPDGWFMSGDLGLMTQAGNLEIVGRSKDLIIRGGHNIYPAEIEALALRHAEVAALRRLPGRRRAARRTGLPRHHRRGAAGRTARTSGSRGAVQIRHAGILRARRRLPADTERQDPQTRTDRDGPARRPRNPVRPLRREQGQQGMSVELFQQDGIAVLRLNRPQALNALSGAIVNEISAGVDQVAAWGVARAVRALIVTGAGDKAFCAGADIKEFQGRSMIEAKRAAEIGQLVFAKLDRLPVASVAVINGYAFGGGMELALACSFRLAARSAKMALPEIKLGVIPGYGGTQRLPRLIGEGRALEMIMTGRTVGADEAERIGLVNRIYDGEAIAAGIAFASEFCGYSLPVLGFAREAVMRAIRCPDPRRPQDRSRSQHTRFLDQGFGRRCGRIRRQAQAGVQGWLIRQRTDHCHRRQSWHRRRDRAGTGAARLHRRRHLAQW